jgi:DNA polymerase-3 subunit beta
MKLTLQRDELLTACKIASMALPEKEVKPVLHNFKLAAKDNVCTLAATDLELSLRFQMAGTKVHAAGEAVLPAKQLTEILRESTDQELALEAATNRCVIRGQNNEFEMPTWNPTEFPDIPTFMDNKCHELAADVLSEMIRRTSFAAAKESPRYALTGILWELDGKQARLVAMDGRRLAVATSDAAVHGGHTTNGQTLVVPIKAMNLLERILQSSDESVRVSLKANEAMFRTKQATLCSRLLGGRYPNYRDVFPKRQTVKVALEADGFHAAVRQAAIMTDKESKRISLHLTKDKLTLRAETTVLGRSKVELPLKYDGKELKINVNPFFLTDMLRVMPPETSMLLEQETPTAPVVLSAGPDYSYVIMPMI